MSNTTTTDREVSTMSTIYTTSPAEVVAAKCGTELVTVEPGIRLVVNRRSFGKPEQYGMTTEAHEAAVIANTLQPMEVVLTQDGRAYHDGWHEGPSERQVYVERWTPMGRVFHGWLDADSRQLVQAG